MSILSAISRFAGEYSRGRARYLSERAVYDLPIEVRKDLGWPGANDTGLGSHLGVGTWAGAR